MLFEEFARLHGLLIEVAYASEKIRRCATADHPRARNGAYFYDGRRGWVMCWDGDGELHWWNDPNDKPWSEQERRAWRQRRSVAQDIERRKHDEAAARATALLGDCELATHPYLSNKGFPDVRGFVSAEHELLVPMRALAGNAVRGVQRIFWTPPSLDTGEAGFWTKKFLYGMAPREAVLRLGSAQLPETWLCEGYATGLSIEAALRRLQLQASVLVCFSDHNMVQVARYVTGRKFTFADHDPKGAGQRAAEKIGAPVAMSSQVGEDANDLHQRAGLMAVCKLLLEARRQ
jgi:putative DNA primase/helicase